MTSRTAVITLIGLAAAALGVYLSISLLGRQPPAAALTIGGAPFASASAPRQLPELRFTDLETTLC